MNPSLLLLFFITITASSRRSEVCSTDDDLLLRQKPGRSRSGFEKNLPATKWHDHDNIIPYHFASNVPNKDKITAKKAMETYSKNTCLRFKELTTEPYPGHRLEISSEDLHKSCNEAAVSPYDQIVTMTLRGIGCSEGLILHELGHVLGLIHTQRRPDRDNYISVKEDCIGGDTEEEIEQWKHQYKKVSDHLVDLHNVPYMCNSMMHYNNFYPDYDLCKVITPKPGSNCLKINVRGDSYVGTLDKPLEEDWLLINRTHCEARPTENCKDSNANCARWESLGHCQRHPDSMAREGCKLSCNKCKDPTDDNCKDLYDEARCTIYADNGFCHFYKKWMEENCKKSCKFC